LSFSSGDKAGWEAGSDTKRGTAWSAEEVDTRIGSADTQSTDDKGGREAGSDRLSFSSGDKGGWEAGSDTKRGTAGSAEVDTFDGSETDCGQF
jgi:hypothetical protein